MLLRNITVLGKSINLAEQPINDDSNVVTILMGSNGSGKSRIFQAISSSFIRAHHESMITHHLNEIVNTSDLEQFESLSYTYDGDLYSIFSNRETFYQRYDFKENGFVTISSEYPYKQATIHHKHNMDSDYSLDDLIAIFLDHAKHQSYPLGFIKNGLRSNTLKLPNKVLAVTGSPYDKFPFTINNFNQQSPSPYVYLGARQARHASYMRERGYLSYKFDQLGASFIKLLLKPKQEYFDFSKMLDFLNISNSFTLKLFLSERIRANELNQDSILDLVRSVRFFKNKDHEIINNGMFENNLSQKLFEAIKYIGGDALKNNDYFRPIEISCKVDLTEEDNDKRRLSSLELLSEYDLIELDDVVFSKLGSRKEFLLSQASSGELSLLFAMSSIAGEIQDGSLILIDEPEISLHPKWQLSFLSLLVDIFSNYKSCHFIIATHSPNIVSSIPDENAFIVNIETEKTQLEPSEKYHNRSADFQLASIFNAPGNNNEYLLSQVIEVLDSICKSNQIDEMLLHKSRWLLSFENMMDDGDKVKVLLNVLKKTLEALKIK